MKHRGMKHEHSHTTFHTQSSIHYGYSEATKHRIRNTQSGTTASQALKYICGIISVRTLQQSHIRVSVVSHNVLSKQYDFQFPVSVNPVGTGCWADTLEHSSAYPSPSFKGTTANSQIWREKELFVVVVAVVVVVLVIVSFWHCLPFAG